MVSMIAGIVSPSLLAIAARQSSAQRGAAGSGALALGTLAALRFFAVGMMRLGVGKSPATDAGQGQPFEARESKIEKVRELFGSQHFWQRFC